MSVHDYLELQTVLQDILCESEERYAHRTDTDVCRRAGNLSPISEGRYHNT